MRPPAGHSCSFGHGCLCLLGAFTGVLCSPVKPNPEELTVWLRLVWVSLRSPMWTKELHCCPLRGGSVSPLWSELWSVFVSDVSPIHSTHRKRTTYLADPKNKLWSALITIGSSSSLMWASYCLASPVICLYSNQSIPAGGSYTGVQSRSALKLDIINRAFPAIARDLLSTQTVWPRTQMTFAVKGLFLTISQPFELKSCERKAGPTEKLQQCFILVLIWTRKQTC